MFINTIPKAGTYMYARLLEVVGYENCGVHLGAQRLWDFRAGTLDEVIAAPEDFVMDLGADVAWPLVAPGQFAVGHLVHATDQFFLEDCRHLLAVRDLRDVLVSHMRFILDPRRRDRPEGDWGRLPDGPDRFLGYLDGPAREIVNEGTRIASWMSTGAVTLIRFEDVMGDHGPAARRGAFRKLANLLEVGSPRRLERRFLRDVMGHDTRTFSGRRSEFAAYTTPDVDRMLDEIGATDLNRSMGYW